MYLIKFGKYFVINKEMHFSLPLIFNSIIKMKYYSSVITVRGEIV